MEYTIGEIYRLGLLKGRNGAYRGKEGVSRALRGVPYTERPTRHGPGKFYKLEDLQKLQGVQGEAP